MRHLILLLTLLLLAAPSLGAGSPDTGFRAGGQPARNAATNGRQILFVGDSWTIGSVTDECWAQYAGCTRNGGIKARFDALNGNTVGESHTGIALTSGQLFGTGAPFDIAAYVDNHTEISDVVLMIGTNDMITSAITHCAHTSIPNSPASGPCTEDQTEANLKYVLDQMNARGIKVFFHLNPGLIGRTMNADAGIVAAATDQIEDLTAELIAHCVGKTCYASSTAYSEFCAGSITYPDVTGGTACAADNLLDYESDGSKANRLNSDYYFAGDAIQEARVGEEENVHPSGPGYMALFRNVMASMNASDSTIAGRFTAFSYDFTLRPPIPQIIVDATDSDGTYRGAVITSTGLYINGMDGTAGKCGIQGECKYYCWVTCNDFAGSGADPSCADGAEPNVVRTIGSPFGASHLVAEGNVGPRITVEVKPVVEVGWVWGQSGPVGTAYKMVCAAVSPTAISHPTVVTFNSAILP